MTHLIISVAFRHQRPAELLTVWREACGAGPSSFCKNQDEKAAEKQAENSNAEVNPWEITHGQKIEN